MFGLRAFRFPEKTARTSARNSLAVTRAEAISRVNQHFHSGEFLVELGRRVAYPTESQNAGRRDALRAYLELELLPAFSELGFASKLIESPSGKHLFLLAEYKEAASSPTVLMYGHGDVVDGMVGRWRDGLDPWQLTSAGNRVYGRGTADNKGQHSINLSALRAVREARGGRLGFNAKFTDFKIQNIVGSCDVKFPIRLEGLASKHHNFSSYEPVLFPGLIYRMMKPKIVLLIFVSGKIVLTGAKVREEIYQAFELIYPVLSGKFHTCLCLSTWH